MATGLDILVAGEGVTAATSGIMDTDIIDGTNI